MLICSIETSCDETAVSFVQATGGLKSPRFFVLGNVVSSQIKKHAPFGGVVPLLAAREHAKNIERVFKLALKQANIEKEPDLIAVTRGPGLMPSLRIGVAFARSLSYFSKIPVLGVNHLEGHMYANLLAPMGQWSQTQIEFPAVSLIISGGHTELYALKKYGAAHLVGQTHDDAVGECFDKTARLLGLGYPGGPLIDKLGQLGNAFAYEFPAPMIYAKNFDFSFSGLKTAMLYFLKDHKFDFNRARLSAKQEVLRNDICASFERAAARVLVSKTMRLANKEKAKTVIIGGGVAANSYIRSAFEQAGAEQGFSGKILFPNKGYITDNAAMIAVAGYIAHLRGDRDTWRTLGPEANLRLRDV